jgi:hypothetical protein
MRAVVLVALAVAAAVAGTARADIVVTLDRTSARPGDLVRATSSSCCFLSLYLVPAARVPQPGPCPPPIKSGGCEPWSIGPPHRRGWTWLGRLFPHRPSVRFRVPNVPAGLYRAVVYCAPCYRGPWGSLIAGAQQLTIR